MKIAVASGKGGTGKTTVATNLAYVAAQNGRSVAYVDCDVEEPNGHVFLQPAITIEKPVNTTTPQVDPLLCTHCGDCGELCQYSAIVCINDSVLVFPELCHACGGCALACAPFAITEVPREIGKLAIGKSGSIEFVQGLLNIGEAMSPPIIRAVKAAVPEVDLTIIDAPPGTSCPVVESVDGCDLVLLVTEPTPFGLHDLGLAVDMIKEIDIPCRVVVNRASEHGLDAAKFCAERGIEILAELPEDREVASAYSRGELAAQSIAAYGDRFRSLLKRVEDLS